jgi:hypothetical protein
MKTTQTIMLSGAKDAVEVISNHASAQSGSQSRVTERKNLDGTPSTWIAIASLAAQAIPIVLAFVKDYAATKQIKKIKWGDLEIDNPTREDVQKVLELMEKEARTGQPAV